LPSLSGLTVRKCPFFDISKKGMILATLRLGRGKEFCFTAFRRGLKKSRIPVFKIEENGMRLYCPISPQFASIVEKKSIKMTLI
jgi:hypothetical protein